MLWRTRICMFVPGLVRHSRKSMRKRPPRQEFDESAELSGGRQFGDRAEFLRGIRLCPGHCPQSRPCCFHDAAAAARAVGAVVGKARSFRNGAGTAKKTRKP